MEYPAPAAKPHSKHASAFPACCDSGCEKLACFLAPHCRDQFQIADSTDAPEVFNLQSKICNLKFLLLPSNFRLHTQSSSSIISESAAPAGTIGNTLAS